MLKITKQNNFDDLSGHVVYMGAASVFNIDDKHTGDEDFYDYAYVQGNTPHTPLYRHISEMINVCRIKRIRSIKLVCACKSDYCMSDVIMQIIEESTI